MCEARRLEKIRQSLEPATLIVAKRGSYPLSAVRRSCSARADRIALRLSLTESLALVGKQRFQ
jgi:hypothetical protein